MPAPHPSASLSGFVLLYKPVGPGSQALLSAVKRLAGTRRVGHAGTLDPFASGLLPVAVGRATRLIDRLHLHPKTYEAELRLGLETDTLDLEGAIVATSPVPWLDPATIDRCLTSFLGRHEQSPPAYSAIRVAGQRSYDLARSGRATDPPSRTIHIHGLSLLDLCPDRLRFRVTCSTGTYVRSLGRDIARALGTAGHLTRLVRTRVGPFTLRDALTAGDLRSNAERLGFPPLLLPPDVLLDEIPAIVLDAAQERRVLQGMPVPTGTELPPGTEIRAYGQDGRLLALLRAGESGLAPGLLLK